MNSLTRVLSNKGVIETKSFWDTLRVIVTVFTGIINPEINAIPTPGDGTCGITSVKRAKNKNWAKGDRKIRYNEASKINGINLIKK